MRRLRARRKIVDQPPYRAEVFSDALGEFRWRLVSTANGQVVGSAHEGYVKRHHARKMLEQIFTPGAVLIVDES